MMEYRDIPSVQSGAGDYLHLRRPLPLNHLLHRRYRITGVLSDKGGFDLTYRAVDTYCSLNLAVVVKEHFPHGMVVRNPDTLELQPVPGMETIYAKTLQRFEEEAELLSTFDHPNIVRVKAHFSELNTAYYVMPYIGGTELHNALPSPAELSEAVLLPVLRCLLQTLHYMHGYNLMHRDIKPTNILIDDKGTPILIDFGLVLSTDATHTLTRNYTLGYAPVEQILGSGKSGPWTDLYSLGATCYALITGSAPPDALDRLEKDKYTPLQSRAELLNRYSPALLSGIDRALQVKRADRWLRAQDWLDAQVDCTPKTVTIIPEPVTVVPAELTLRQPADTEPHTDKSVDRKKEPKKDGENNTKKSNGFLVFIVVIFEILLVLWLTIGYTNGIGRASRAGHPALLRSFLILPGIDVNKTDEWGDTPLTAAVNNSHKDCVRLLLECPDIDVNKRGSFFTPLIEAVVGNRVECMQLLLAAPGIDVNRESAVALTPLHHAASNGRIECVRLLLEAPGIDVNKVADDGLTPLDKAIRNGHTGCAQLIRAAGGVVNATELRGK